MSVLGLLHHGVVIGHQDGIEGVGFKALHMHGRCIGTVPRHPQKPHQPLLFRFKQRFHGPARTHGSFPLVCLGQIMHLNEINLVHLHPL